MCLARMAGLAGRSRRLHVAKTTRIGPNRPPRRLAQTCRSRVSFARSRVAAAGAPAMPPELIAIIAAAATLLGFLWSPHRGVAGGHRDVAGVYRGVAGLRGRMARLEGLFERFIRREPTAPAARPA